MKVYNPAKYDYVTVVEMSKDELERVDMATCKQPRETLKSYYDKQEVKPDILINGGFFSMADGTPCFYFVDEGEDLSEQDAYTYGIGVVDENELIYANVFSRTDWRDFVSGYPVLIENGKKCKITFAQEINYNARRTMLGYNDKNVYVVAIDSPGLAFTKMQELMLELGCTYAINLDGGGSTKLLKNGVSLTSVAHNRPVDNVIAFYLKKETEQARTLYRVQCGAFSIKANAEKLQKEIRALPDDLKVGYKNAYIRQINGLYKVQVGAFAKRENADKAVKDLAEMGYNAFITTK